MDELLERPIKRICLEPNEKDAKIFKDKNKPHFGIKYKLDMTELNECIRIGKERNMKNCQQNTKNINYSKRDDSEIHIQGVIGEYVFCKLFDLPITINDTSCRNVFNEKTFDCRFPTGETVDVKTTIYSSVDIRVFEQKKHNPPTFYALVIIENLKKDQMFHDLANADSLKVSFRGMIPSEKLLCAENLKACGKDTKNFYCVSQKILEKEYANLI